MEIRQLEALNAIVTTGSVTAAGRALGRSQPVVSRQISDLEGELGFILFERTRPTITLTPLGAEFCQEIRGILADLQKLESRVLDMRNGQDRPLRILAAMDLARGLLPEALAHLDQYSPGLFQKLIIEELVHEATHRLIHESHTDFALINLPIDGEDLRIHWCGQAPCLLALPASHPLVEQNIVGLEDIGGSNVITLLGRYRMRYQLINSLVQVTLGHSRRHIQVGSQHTALSMVRSGLGIALIDPFSLRGTLLDGIELRPIHADIQYMIGVVSQASHPVPDDAAQLIQGLHSHVRGSIPYFVDTNPYGLQRAGRLDVSA